jgi:hypothetical protein
MYLKYNKEKHYFICAHYCCDKSRLSSPKVTQVLCRRVQGSLGPALDQVMDGEAGKVSYKNHLSQLSFEEVPLVCTASKEAF